MKARTYVLAVVCLATLCEGAVHPSAAATPTKTPFECPVDDVPLFAVGSSPATPGFFFPGTAIYDGSDFVGAPYAIPRGCDLRFVNLDVGAIANGHQIISLRRRRGRPWFRSEFSVGPGVLSVRTRHLKLGLYPYFCSIHAGMFGLLEVRPTVGSSFPPAEEPPVNQVASVATFSR